MPGELPPSVLSDDHVRQDQSTGDQCLLHPVRPFSRYRPGGKTPGPSSFHYIMADVS
jgi:hypothetical protein